MPHPDVIDLNHMARKVKEVMRAAGLRDGGFTEGGHAGLTEAQIRAQGRHKSAKVIPKYVKRTMRQVAEGARKRRASRGSTPNPITWFVSHAAMTTASAGRSGSIAAATTANAAKGVAQANTKVEDTDAAKSRTSQKSHMAP